MNLDDLEPLPEEMRLLLREGRPGAEPPAGAKAAISAFLAAHAAVAGAALVTASTRASVTSPGTTALKRWSALKGSFGIGGIVLGAAVGAGGHAAYVAQRTAHAPTPVLVRAAVEEPAIPMPVPSLPPWSAVPVDPIPPVAPSVPRAAHDEKGTTDSSLSVERALVDMARTAVARGDGIAALPTLEKHTRDFPHGRLAEEREWLTIQALVAAGRGAEARGRATTFRRVFPHSLMLPALEQLAPETRAVADAGAGPP